MLLREKFVALLDSLDDFILEREKSNLALILGLLSGSHVLLLGPPGTGKSLQAQTICNAIENTSFFSWLLTRFSTPEEVFGPISVKGLKDDHYRRKTDGMLPESYVAFLDEIFKANSSILNAMLTIINERVFYNDGQAHKVPLVSVVGASNELPEGEELDALYDRFPLRFWVDYLSEPENISTLLFGSLSPPSIKITLEQLETAQDSVKTVFFPDETREQILEIKARLEDEGHRASDRRWKAILKVLTAHAWLYGDTVVSSEHFELLPDMLWSEPKDRSSIAQIVGVVGDPISVKAGEIFDAAKEAFRAAGYLQTSPTAEQKSDWVRGASLIDTQLQQMIMELDALGNGTGSKPKKAQQALEGVRKLRERLLHSMQAAFSI